MLRMSRVDMFDMLVHILPPEGSRTGPRLSLDLDLDL